MLVENNVKKDLFLDHLAMIEQAAWKTAKRFNIEFEEAEGQAYLVFCETIERFDNTKGTKFSTYLYSRLRTVADKYAKPKSIAGFQYDKEPTDSSMLAFINAMETLETALQLSEDAQGVLNFLISREWETPGVARTPRLHSVQNWLQYQFDWTPARTKRAWEELKTWWKAEGQYAYSLGGAV